MKPMNELEKKVLEMIKEGKPLHGFARDVAIEMALREQEKKKD